MSDDFSICYRHNSSIKNLRKLRELLFNKAHFELHEDFLKVMELIDGTTGEIKLARNSGKSMEKRLRKYRENIESLGYTRKKKYE